jgi:hypothetical protein
MIRLTKILKESVLQELIGFALVQFALWTISMVIKSFRNKSEYKKFTQEPHIKWLDRIGNHTNFNKYVYYTIKNDKKLKEFETKIEKDRSDGQKTNIDFSKLQYERDLVRKWLNSKIAQEELDKVFKELHPDKTQDSRDIPTPGSNLGIVSTYKQWKNLLTNQAVKEWAAVLNDGTTKKFINKFAKAEGLPAI